MLVGAFRFAGIPIDRHLDEVAGDGGLPLVVKVTAHLEAIPIAVVGESGVVMLGEEFTTERRHGAQWDFRSGPAAAETCMPLAVSYSSQRAQRASPAVSTASALRVKSSVGGGGSLRSD